MAQQQTEQPKILAVDDKKENLIVLEKLLAPLNVELYKATSGNDALALTLEHDFVLVLLDVQMPGMDGYEVLEMMSWEEKTRYIPVIFITANYADEQHKLKGYEYGAVDYLYKPINERILLSKVKVFLELYQERQNFKHLMQRHQSILEAAGEGIFELNTDGHISFMNPAAAQLLGYSTEELQGHHISKVIINSDETSTPPAWEDTELYQTCSTGNVLRHDDALFLKADHEQLPIEYSATPLLEDNNGYRGIVIVFTDITLRKTVEEQLTHLALYDHLTQLPNRHMFEKTINQSIARAKRHNRSMALMFLDLDHFKNINDTLGHDIGDLLLQGVADRLKTCIRASDTVARLGGDEFAVILDEVEHAEDASVVAEKILEVLAPPFNLNNHEVFASTSIGIATYPSCGDSAITLTKNADISMYEAKQQGRNNYRFFTSDMTAQNMHRLNLAHSLRRALERDELFLCYQPKYSVVNTEIKGMEALMRWNHPHLGLVSPTEFIPIAEETGLILALGEWVLQQACLQNKAWQDAGLLEERVAVNVSTTQLMQNELITQVKQALNKADLDPCYLELELTESSVMTNAPNCAKALIELHDLGVHISIDDFGTGYSSLSYLKTLPVDTLKIDQSFVRDVAYDPDDASIVKSIIALAHNMELNVIAEGVETKQQLDFLAENGCDQIQGYYYSKPLPADEFKKLLLDSQ